MKKKYKLTNSEMILRDDGANIPPSNTNRDYREYLEWIAQGNTPDPANAPTDDELIAVIEDAVQNHLDSTAQSRGYTSMERLCGWAQSTNLTWQAEALTAIKWRDLCFESTYEIINRGAPYPTPAEVVAQLPPIVWPVL